MSLVSLPALDEHDRTMWTDLVPFLTACGIGVEHLHRGNPCVTTDLRLHNVPELGTVLADWKWHGKPDHIGMHMLDAETAAEYDEMTEPLLIISCHRHADLWTALRRNPSGQGHPGKVVVHVWEGRTWDEVFGA